MKNVQAIIFFAICSLSSLAQKLNTIEGTVINNNEIGLWYGVNIPRSIPTKLIFKNNSISSLNAQGYLLQAGDENPSERDHHLDNQEITGNKFSWNGPNDPKIITHGLFTGYNINSIVKYNLLINVPYGIIFKSGTNDGKSMTFTSGGCAYNICKNGKFAVRMKGINGVKVYNNTFYNGDGSGRYLVLITSNQDRVIPPPSTDSKIFNNIFYSTTQIPMISIETKCLLNFESDYNVFWCTSGEPIFAIDGVNYTWEQWKSKGFDLHSKVLNPNFNNTTEFVPIERLDVGLDLGAEWLKGLSTKATWVPGERPETVDQNGKWQVGARIWQDNIKPNLNDSIRGYLIYPNPTYGKIKIHVDQIPSAGVDVEIKNLLGQLLLRRKIFENTTEWSINQYSGSLLFITLSGENLFVTEKVILNSH